MADPALTVVARRVTMAIRAPAVQRLTIKAPAPVRLTVKPRTTVAIAVPRQGPPGPQGEKGDTGPAGPAAPPPMRWPIVNAASFTAAHGLAYPPDAQILTADGEVVEADVFHAPGQTTVMFPGPFTGSLYLR